MKLFLISGILFSACVLGNALTESEKEAKMHPGVYRDPSRQINQDPVYESKEFWFASAQKALESKLGVAKIEKRAKNVIFFLGDGMSVPTVTAARIFKGQRVDDLPFGEEGELHMDSFPNIGVSKTFCSDAQVADSACTATAYLCGTKANCKTIGVSPDVKLDDCIEQMKPENQVSSILAWSQDTGKSTGAVTTSRITDASPVGLYAHIAQRDWEDDMAVRASGFDPETCHDITKQLIFDSPGRDINVIMVGGRNRFLPNDTQGPEAGFGTRGDGINMIEEWKKRHPEKAVYATDAAGLASVDPNDTDYLLGLFADSEIAYLDSLEAENDPSLEEMTIKAIKILEKNPKGYFLFVEGGRIDHAHHASQAQRALWETIEFDKAIKAADELTDDEDTLILVTADHAHVMTLAGYPDRGNPLLGNTGIAPDGLPHPTLAYANGLGYRNDEGPECTRHDVSGDDVDSVHYRQISLAPLGSETHGGDDVLIFSKGPFAHLLTGVQMQSYIPHVLGYASCVGEGPTFCDFDCPGPNGNFPDLEDCAAFYTCMDGVAAEHHYCPDGFLFNPAISNCDYPWNVDCPIDTTTPWRK